MDVCLLFLRLSGKHLAYGLVTSRASGIPPPTWGRRPAGGGVLLPRSEGRIPPPMCPGGIAPAWTGASALEDVLELPGDAAPGVQVLLSYCEVQAVGRAIAR